MHPINGKGKVTLKINKSKKKKWFTELVAKVNLYCSKGETMSLEQ